MSESIFFLHLLLGNSFLLFLFYLPVIYFICLDNYSMMAQSNAMASQGYNNMRSGFSNQMLSQQSQRRFNVKVDKTIGPVILRYSFYCIIFIQYNSHLLIDVCCIKQYSSFFFSLDLLYKRFYCHHNFAPLLPIMNYIFPINSFLSNSNLPQPCPSIFTVDVLVGSSLSISLNSISTKI